MNNSVISRDFPEPDERRKTLSWSYINWMAAIRQGSIYKHVQFT